MPSSAALPANPPRPTAAGMPGFKGMWVAISLELVEFTVFFVVYFAMRWHYPEVFRRHTQELWTLGGFLITVVMLTSGYLLVRAVDSVRHGQQRAARWQALAALMVSLGYPLAKWLEIEWNRAHGIAAGDSAFFTVYYYLTINHFIHSSWGILGMAWVTVRLWLGAYTPGDLRGRESLAIYWHATDIVWLMLFSLFYAFV